MPSSESRSGLVLELAEEFLERYRKGERPAIKEYIDRHPELEAEIREVFPAMAMMEKIALTEEGEQTAEPKEPKGKLPFEQLGDFRLIREVGRGGMGVVYEAEQVSLGRHVALKVLPQQIRDIKQRTRFEREAKAAAKLHHTNIVPVFGVGEQDGQPYYVMQFIQGLGLDAVLDELNRMQPGDAHTPTGLPTAGEIRISRRDVSAADVARSLMTGAFPQPTSDKQSAEPDPQRYFAATLDQPAKNIDSDSAPTSSVSASTRLSDSFTVSSSSISLPNASKTGHKTSAKKQTYWQSVANIGHQVADALDYAHKQGILHRDIKPSNLLLDLRGTVWVTDFGLAKVAGPGADNLTHTGDVLGTLRYMPPEAFEGKSDARGDVYSLGLTLYELIALRPAFSDRDRNKLIKQVTTGEPQRLDKVNREIPRDLVTIIHKAINREPGRRYATAEDFASDLQRFIDDEPILARRQSHIERYWRWARHHPGIASLGAALAAVLVIATVASLIVAGRMATLASNEAKAADDERTARNEAVEAQSREAKEREQAELARISADESKQRAVKALQKAEENFAKARAAVNDYLTSVSEDERLKAPGFQGLRKQLLESALQFYQEFLKERGNDPSLRRELAGVYYKVGEIYRDLIRTTASRSAHAQALRLYEALVAESPNDLDLQHGLAMSLFRTGEQVRAIPILEKLINPDDPRFHADLGDLYNTEALDEKNKNDTVKQLDFHRKALAVRERLVRLRPDDVEARLGYGGSLNNIAIRLKEDRNAEALALIQRAVEQTEAALRLQPAHLTAARYLTIGLSNVARKAKLAGETEVALAAHRRRVEVLDRRARDNPTHAGFDAELVAGYSSLLVELRQAGRWEEAAKTAEKAIARLAESTDDTATFYVQVLTFRLTVHSVALAWAKADPDANVNIEKEAAAAVQAIRDYVLAGWRTGDDWMRTDSRTESLRQRADFKELLARMDELSSADAKAKLTTVAAEEKRAARQTILTTLEAVAGPPPHARFVRRNLAQARQEWAQALLEAGQVEEARLAFDDALLARQQLAQESPSNEQLRADLAQSQSTAGDIFAAAGKLADAVRTWDKALATLEDGLKTNPNSIPFQAALVERLHHVAAQSAKFGLWDVAARHYGRAVAVQSPTQPNSWNFIALVAAATRDLPLLRAVAGLAAGSSENTGDPGAFRHRTLITSPITAAAHPAAIRHLAEEFQNPWHNIKWARALAYLRVGQVEKAFQTVEGLTPAEKAWPEWQTLSLIQHRLGHAKEAAEALRQADLLAERRMKDVVAGDQLKLPLLWDEWLHNQLLRAEAHQAIHAQPISESPYEKLFRARVFLALEQHDQAEAEFVAAVALRPDDAEVWLTRSRIFARLDRKDRMAADLLRAQLLKGDDPKTWIEAGRMLAERGEHKQADVAFARASALGKGELNRFLESGWWVVGPYPEQLDMPCPPELNSDPAKTVAAVGDHRELKWQAVSTTAHRGNIQLPSSIGGRSKASSYALNYVHADRDQTAIMHLWPKHDARVWVNGRLVFAGFGQGQKSGIIQIPVTFRKGRNTLLIKNRHDAGAFCECAFLDAPIRRGYELVRLGSWSEAADAFADADRREPLQEYPTRLRIHALLATGRAEESRRVFAEFVRRYGQHGNVELSQADLSPPLKTDDRERWLASAKKSADEKPTETYRFHRLANAHFRLGQFAEAETNLRKAMARDQLYFHPLLASTLHQLGKIDEAMRVLMEMEEKHAGLVKNALAATPYRPAQQWEEELWYSAMLQEARTLILGKDPGPTAEETELLAKAHARSAELEKAEDDYARLVEKQPNHPRLWIARGRRLGELQRWDEAAKAFDKAAELKPNDVHVWKERGRAFAELGKWDEAAADFVKAIELAPAPKAKPPQFPWTVDRSGIDDLLVQWDEVFERVTKLRPKDTVLWARRAQHFARLGRWAEVEPPLLRHHELEPGNHWGPYRVAPLLAIRGHVDGYRQIVSSMAKRHSHTSNWSIAEKVARTALLLPGEFTDFEALTAMLDRGAKDAASRPASEAGFAMKWTRLARAQVAYRSGDFDGAIHQLTLAGPPMDGPNDMGAETLIVLAMARQQLGDPVAARAALVKARATVEKHAARPELGWLHEDGKWHHWLRCRVLIREAESMVAKDLVVVAAPGALSAQDYAASRDRKARSDSLATQSALALIRIDVGQKKEAEAELRTILAEREKIVAEEPGNLDYQADLAAAHEQLGQFLVGDGRVEEGVKETQKAVVLLEKFAAGNPKAARLQINLAANLFSVGSAHWKAGQHEEGRQAWDRALENLKAARMSATQDPKLARMAGDLELVAGRAYVNLELWTEASEHYRRAFATDPVAGTVSDRLNHAALLILTGDDGEYRRYCTRVYERSEKSLQDRWSTRMMLLGPGALPDPKDVVALAQDARTGTNNEPWSVLDVALAQLRADQVDVAFATLQEFETVSKNEWQFSWPSLALARHKAGKIDEAREWLRKIDDWYADQWLKTLAGDGSGITRGNLFAWGFFLGLRQEAIATVTGNPAPADPWLHLHRGRVYVKLGQSEKAEAEFQAAVRVQPDGTRILLARSQIYASLGKKAEAQADRARAADLAEQALIQRPDDTAAADTLARLLLEKMETKWTALKPLAVKSEGGATLTVQPDNSVLASGKSPERDVYTVEAEVDGPLFALKLEVLTDPTLPNNGPGRSDNGNFHLKDIRVTMAPGGAVVWSRAYADFEQNMFWARNAIDADPNSFWGIDPRQGYSHWAVFVARKSSSAASKVRITIRLDSGEAKWVRTTLGRFRLSVASESELVQQSDWLLAAHTPHAKVGAAYLAVGDAKQAVAFLTKATAANPKLPAADWLILGLAHTYLNETEQARKAYASAAELLKPTDAALRPLLREVVRILGINSSEAIALFAAASGQVPAALNEAIEKDPNQAKGYRDRGNWFAQRGRWKDAIPDHAEAYRLEPEVIMGMRLGICLLQTGDIDSYRTLCQDMLTKWALTEKNGEADQLLKLNLLVPDYKGDAKQLARLAEVSVSGNKNVASFDWFLLSKGLHDYRTGKYADALGAVREVRRRATEAKFSPIPLANLNLAVLEAMALHQTGDLAVARHALEEAKVNIENQMPMVGVGGWSHDWLTAHILLREAEELIAAKKVEPPK